MPWPVCLESVVQDRKSEPKLAKIKNDVHQCLAPAGQVIRTEASKVETGVIVFHKRFLEQQAVEAQLGAAAEALFANETMAPDSRS
ncbi:hypothetical protein ABBQ38_005266 [Trebouxia sp. C0009 RCD-2024]